MVRQVLRIMAEPALKLVNKVGGRGESGALEATNFHEGAVR